jgi:hypothetical protein
MNRIRVSLLLLLIGRFASADAQLPPIEVQKLRPNLLLVTGANANTVVFVRSTDVVVIDTKGPRAGWGRAVADRHRS